MLFSIYPPIMNKWRGRVSDQLRPPDQGVLPSRTKAVINGLSPGGDLDCQGSALNPQPRGDGEAITVRRRHATVYKTIDPMSSLLLP